MQDARRKAQGARRKILDARCRIFCLLSLASSFLILFLIPSSYAQTPQESIRDGLQPDTEVYHESALRRAEIIFTTSIPFTAIHSYFAVRGVEMARQRKVSPKMEDNDWTAVIGLTITFSGFIAFWDWLHTRDEDISNRNLKPKDKIESLDGKYQINGISTMNDSVLASLYMNF